MARVTVEDCIETMAKIINNRLNENCTTIETIGKSGRYCDKKAADLWIKNVLFFLNRM